MSPFLVAIILFAISLLSLVSPAIALIQQKNVGDNVSAVLSILLEVIVFFEYIKYAKEVLNAAK